MARIAWRRSHDVLGPLAAAGLAATFTCKTKSPTLVSCSEGSPSRKTWAHWLVQRVHHRRHDHDKKTKILLARRKELGWENMRSERARALVGDKELKLIATLINDLVDLDSWSEDQEQELFEHATAQCIEEMCLVLPPPFFDLLHTRHGCLEDQTRTLLFNHMFHALKDNCIFPYLDEQDKRRIIRAVIWCLMEAMKEGKDLESFAENVGNDACAQDIIVEVFIEGAMDVFFDDDMRKELATEMTSYIEDVPFVPHAFIEKMAEAILKSFSFVLHETLKEAFLTFKDACANGERLPVLPDILEEDTDERTRVLETYKDKPFLVQLRRLFINKLIDGEKEVVGKSPIGRLMCLNPDHFKAKWYGRLVDLVFGQLEGLQKVEETVQPFHKSPHDHEHHEHHEIESLESEQKPIPQPEPKARSEIEQNGTIAELALKAEQWPECFISFDQPFGFSPSAAADYIECPSTSSSSADAAASQWHKTEMPPVDVAARSAAKTAPSMEARQLSLEAKLLGKLSAIRNASTSSAFPGGKGEPNADFGQVQRIAALKVAIMGLETYLGSYVVKSSSQLSTPCSTPAATEKYAGA